MADPFRYFRIEAGEILEQLQGGLLELERGAPPVEIVPKLLRLAHTLKGAARVVKQKGIADHAHAVEDWLVPVRDSGALIVPAIIEGSLQPRRCDARRASGVVSAGRSRQGGLLQPRHSQRREMSRFGRLRPAWKTWTC